MIRELTDTLNTSAITSPGHMTGIYISIAGLALAIGGVPMAMILGILTGLLAFIPNIGAFISGALMIAVGFSAGTHVDF